MAKSNLTKAKEKLWKVFSEYIRLRDSKDGYNTCVTCGKVINWKYETDAGHFRSRKNNATFVHEKNVHPQCKGCNIRGEEYVHGKYIDARYGEGTADELTDLSRTTYKFSIYELEELTEHYKEEVKKLKKSLGIQ